MSPEIQAYIDERIRLHLHDGAFATRVNFFDLLGSIRTISDATTLTNALASTPRSPYEQIFIDTSTATKKLYIYDFNGNKWLSADSLTTH